MKRITALLFVSILMCVMVSCGSAENGDSIADDAGDAAPIADDADNAADSGIVEEIGESSVTDYPAAIMVDNVIYLMESSPMPAEIEESAIIGYTTGYTETFPEKNGETNFNPELNMPYAKAEGGLAVLYQNEWYFCRKHQELKPAGEEPDEKKTPTTPDEIASYSILTTEHGKYAEGECIGEGHIILGSDEREENGNRIVTLYMLTMYGEYQFQDGNFVKESGSGVIPVVLTCEVNQEQEYVLKDYQMPLDGGGYSDSIHELFPEEYWDDCISPGGERQKELVRQERSYAETYLKEIGRQAQIGDYGDFEHKLLTDMGVSVEVSNIMSENKELWEYPFWLGNIEKIVNGTRFCYSMELDEEKQLIIYEKFNMDQGETAERFVFNALTGMPQTMS